MKRVIKISLINGLIFFLATFLILSCNLNDSENVFDGVRWTPRDLVEKLPTYSQGYFDGMNKAIEYFSETDQFKDSLYIDLKVFTDHETEKEEERKKELNTKL